VKEMRAPGSTDGQRYAAWFHELDAWTEYWDIYHPETRGRYYFGDGAGEPGLLTRFLPRYGRPAPFVAWTRRALRNGTDTFAREVLVPEVAEAIMEVDSLVQRLFGRHFGSADDRKVQNDYLEATFRFATDTLPAAKERDSRISFTDPRKATAGLHTLEGDIMWFAWALQLEAAHIIAGNDADHARRSLFMAGIAIGCPANFVWRGHRRTRTEYACNETTKELLFRRGLQWSSDFESAAEEIHALYRIREYGSES
jgi:hypothetical protein